MQTTLDYLNISKENLNQITDALRDRNNNLWRKPMRTGSLSMQYTSKSYKVLAISYGHEANASLMIDGNLVASTAEERSTKKNVR